MLCQWHSSSFASQCIDVLLFTNMFLSTSSKPRMGARVNSSRRMIFIVYPMRKSTSMQMEVLCVISPPLTARA